MEATIFYAGVLVSELPPATEAPGKVFLLIDSQTPGDITIGGGNKVTLAYAKNGNWMVLAGEEYTNGSGPPTGAANGQLGGSYPGPDVRGLRETSGPTLLMFNAIADGQYLRRSGTAVVGDTPTGGGGIDQMIVPLVSDAAGIVWTNMPSAVTFFGGSHRFAQKVDLTNYAECRLVVNKQSVAGPSGALVRLRYIVGFDTTVSNWLQIGVSSVEVAINVQNQVLDSGWIALATGAKDDVFVILDGLGGNGTVDPQFGTITAHFR